MNPEVASAPTPSPPVAISRNLATAPRCAAPPAAMPKKMGVNTKAETARARRSAAEADRRDCDARAKEEAYWQAAEGPKSRSACRREEDVENRRLSVIEAELMRRREEEQLRLERDTEAAKKRWARTADEEEYERVVLVANTNRDDSIIEARSWRTPSPRLPSLPSLRSRRIATPSAASRKLVQVSLGMERVITLIGQHISVASQPIIRCSTSKN